MLPSISLIDIDHKSRRFQIRLAGTRLREIYDREITGEFLDEFNWGDQHQYWMAAYSEIRDTGQPAQGVVRGPHDSKDHLVQFWLRLPLSTGQPGRAGMILAFDIFYPANEMPEHKLASA